jgi:hypothetical protein
MQRAGSMTAITAANINRDSFLAIGFSLPEKGDSFLPERNKPSETGQVSRILQIIIPGHPLDGVK